MLGSRTPTALTSTGVEIPVVNSVVDPSIHHYRHHPRQEMLLGKSAPRKERHPWFFDTGIRSADKCK
jgi:hypothetical protein